MRNHSGNKFIDYLATKLTQLLETARVIVGELIVIKAQESQESYVKVADGMNVFNGGHSKFIRRTDGVPRIAAATS